jgi:hypothetical protein
MIDSSLIEEKAAPNIPNIQMLVNGDFPLCANPVPTHPTDLIQVNFLQASRSQVTVLGGPLEVKNSLVGQSFCLALGIS